ncbi:hypothetical protein DIPPA_19838 [Diplonema papillatum]|nr:hypothetical protein DIPPA_19838 [Diplonema papillatum]
MQCRAALRTVLLPRPRAARVARRWAHDSAFDEEYEDMMGPALPPTATLPPMLQPFTDNVVRVGRGTGTFFRAPRDNRGSGIRTGDLLIATTTANALVSNGDTSSLVKTPACPKSGRPERIVPIVRILTQKGSSMSETCVTHGHTRDEGLCLLLPHPTVQQKLENMRIPPVQGLIRNGAFLFGTCWDEKAQTLVGQNGEVDSLLPTPSISEFGPGEWQDSYCGAPMYRADKSVGTQGDELRSKRRIPLAHKSLPLRMMGIVMGHDHSSPYNPLVRIACINSALNFPFARATFANGRWKAVFAEAGYEHHGYN